MIDVATSLSRLEVAEHIGIIQALDFPVVRQGVVVVEVVTVSSQVGNNVIFERTAC